MGGSMRSKWLGQLPYLVHTNRELGLMLKGTKPLAYFMDIVGHEPDICIRYWRMFDRHVALGRLIRRELIEACPGQPQLEYRMLFYALPGHEWRIDAMLIGTLLWLVMADRASSRPVLRPVYILAHSRR